MAQQESPTARCLAWVAEPFTESVIEVRIPSSPGDHTNSPSPVIRLPIPFLTLMQLVPRTSYYIGSDAIMDLGGFLTDLEERGCSSRDVRRACACLFKVLWDWSCRAGQPTRSLENIFHGTNWNLPGTRRFRSQQRREAVTMSVLCDMMHQTRGLGCTGDLLRVMGDWATSHVHRYRAETSVLSQHAMFCDLFGLMKVNSEMFDDQMSVIFLMLDGEARRDITHTLAAQSASTPGLRQHWMRFARGLHAFVE